MRNAWTQLWKHLFCRRYFEYSELQFFCSQHLLTKTSKTNRNFPSIAQYQLAAPEMLKTLCLYGAVIMTFILRGVSKRCRWRNNYGLRAHINIMPSQIIVGVRIKVTSKTKALSVGKRPRSPQHWPKFPVQLYCMPKVLSSIFVFTTRDILGAESCCEGRSTQI